MYLYLVMEPADFGLDSVHSIHFNRESAERGLEQAKKDNWSSQDFSIQTWKREGESAVFEDSETFPRRSK